MKVVFCNDGQLRVQYGINHPMVPLKSFQDMNNTSDTRFIHQWMKREAVFEEGLTIGKFFQCINPWKDFFSDYTGVNVSAFIKEMNEPYVMSQENDWYGVISHEVEINSTSKRTNSVEDYTSIRDYFMDFDAPKEILPFWEFRCMNVLTGYRKGVSEHYDLYHEPMNKIKDYPLFLNPYQTMRSFDICFQKTNRKDEQLINPNAFGLRTVQTEYGEEKFVLGEKSFTFSEVIDGFFNNFNVSPTERDKLTESIRNSISDISNGEDIEDIKEIENSNNTQLAKDTRPNDNFYEREKKYFENVLDFSNSNSYVPVKIGELKENVMPEHRAYQHIIDLNK